MTKDANHDAAQAKIERAERLTEEAGELMAEVNRKLSVIKRLEREAEELMNGDE